MNLKKIIKKKKFIFKATFFIIFAEAIVGSLLVHYVFGINWFISILVALSFATVGEAILVPILDEFGLINSDLGQAIIGVGTLDDIIEIFVLVVLCIYLGSSAFHHFHAFTIVLSLFLIFLFTFFMTKFGKKAKKFGFPSLEVIFLFSLFILFFFIGIGSYGEAAALGSLLAGISVKSFLPKERLRGIEKQIKTICYGLFAPLFFFSVGISLNMSYLARYFLFVLLVVIASKGIKILSSFLIGKKELGTKKSILMGIALSIRFSTSIIIIKILLDNNLISSGLYSVLIASSIVFKFVVPLLLSYLLAKWKIVKSKKIKKSK